MASISARNQEPRAGRPLLPADYSALESGRRKLLSWKWAVDRLRRAHTYWIVTVRPDGRPHAVPIWGVWLDNRFVFATDANSIKVRNLKADPRCEICLEEDCEAITLEGEAREL
jgi:nitroimidazol reductase NimA-like FMN-containing flavoprotein (pyridoxamine 5'-phosphate oxidase superfamily)